MDTLLNVLVFVGILGASAMATHWFTRRMYLTCRACGTLNARRRSHCRRCGQPLGRMRKDGFRSGCDIG